MANHFGEFIISGDLIVSNTGKVSIGTPLASNAALEVNNNTFAVGALLVGVSNGAAIISTTGVGAQVQGVIGVQAYSTTGNAVLGQSQGGGLGGKFQGGAYVETYGFGGKEDASAVFEAASTTKGALMPRMTTTERDAIPSPATGLEIFNTTTNRKEFYNGTYWAASPQIINILSGSANLTTGSNHFFGNMAISTTTTAASRQFISPVSGVIRKAFIRSFASTIVGDRSINVYVRVNSTDYLIATVNTSLANREFTSTSLNIPIVANTDTVVCYAVASGGTTDSTGVYFGGQIIVE